MTNAKLDGFKTLTDKERELGNYYRRSHIMVDRTISYPPTVKVPLWHPTIHGHLTTEDASEPTMTHYAVYELGTDDGGKYLWYYYKGDKDD